MCEVYLSNVFFFWGGIKKQNEHVPHIHVLSEESQLPKPLSRSYKVLISRHGRIHLKAGVTGVFWCLEIWFHKEKKPQKR